MSIARLLSTSLLAVSAAATAAPGGTPAGAAPAYVPPAGALAPGANTAELLSNTYSASGNGSGASLPQYAFTTVATSTVKCNHAHGCSIGIESMAQIQPVGGDWAICLLVDGTSVSCQYQGVQGSTSGWVVGNARGWAAGITTGFHTVETQLYAEGAGAIYAYFQTEARVYKP